MNLFKSPSKAGFVSHFIKQVGLLLAIVWLPLSGYSSGTVTNLNWLDLDAALASGGTVTTVL